VPPIWKKNSASGIPVAEVSLRKDVTEHVETRATNDELQTPTRNERGTSNRVPTKTGCQGGTRPPVN